VQDWRETSLRKNLQFYYFYTQLTHSGEKDKEGEDFLYLPFIGVKLDRLLFVLKCHCVSSCIRQVIANHSSVVERRRRKRRRRKYISFKSQKEQKAITTL
jgi:hypothetical protein